MSTVTGQNLNYDYVLPTAGQLVNLEEWLKQTKGKSSFPTFLWKIYLTIFKYKFWWEGGKGGAGLNPIH